ncbi:hypothetical protein FSW04_10350 [Baekduia soli]|uniref:LapA family protein n=1 Tax=Baekduia soli TaxID=496014 RepID=A0A5B8U4R4_9ACTN|nr:hypothetical protein [Baekduia soli]QEC47931.1 hypothetical protein FSW04_10350 [Baekduia soli]
MSSSHDDPIGTPSTGGDVSRGDRLRGKAHRGRVYSSALTIGVLAGILIALAASNTRHVRVSWVVGSSSVSLVWLVVGAAAIGWLLGIATMVTLRRRARPKA